MLVKRDTKESGFWIETQRVRGNGEGVYETLSVEKNDTLDFEVAENRI